MPFDLPRFCNKTGCRNFKLVGRPYCKEHAAQQQKEERARRGPTKARGYGDQHRKVRLQVLSRDPVCRICGNAPSVVADHIVRFREDGGQQWDTSNLQCICISCHNQKSGREGMRAMRERWERIGD
jgi:5-methylcytosine-specific restriction enzyme A